MPPPSSPSPRAASRADGAQARAKLIHCALRLFAERGLKGTSTREIAQAAGANISAIAYYFGDKAGLYRAVFSEPLGESCQRAAPIDLAGGTLADRMGRFYGEFLAPLKHGEAVRLVMRLHFREMVEPTGLWLDAIENEIRPQHEAMLAMVTRELGLARADADAERLTVAIVGLAVHCFVGQDVIDHVAPALLAGAESIDTLADRLAGFATAMVESERKRRAGARRRRS